MSRAADAPAEWINNDLRSAEVDDANEARIQRDHLVFGDVGGDKNGQAGPGRPAPERNCKSTRLFIRSAAVEDAAEVNAAMSMSVSPSFSSIEASSSLVGVAAEKVSVSLPGRFNRPSG